MSGGEMMALVLSLPSVLLVGSFFWRFLSGREFADQEKRRIEAVVRLQELYWLIDAANERAAAEKAQQEREDTKGGN